MKVFTCIDHDVRYPVGGASVIVAENKSKARVLLNNALRDIGLSTEGYSLQEVITTEPRATILCDGDY